jgi:fibronectin-binding autotransporter adhesin
MGVDSRQSRKLPIRRILAFAALSAVPSAVTSARGDTIAEWQSTLGGTWNSAANWSTNPNFPNNGTPTGTNYQANFDLTAASNYTVSTSGITTLAVDAINITSPNAVVQQNGTSLTVGGINMTAGTYQFRSGTLSGAAPGSTVSIAPTATFQLSGGTLNQLTFTGSNVGCVSASKTITVTNGLNFSGFQLNANQNTLTFNFDGASQTLDQIVLNCAPPTTTKSPILNVGGPTSAGPVTLTLGTGATVQGIATFQDNPSTAGDTLLNDGTVDANTSGQTFTINTSNFTNNATAEVSNGTLLINATNWTNAKAGTISDSGATLSLQGSWSNAGTIATTGAAVVNFGGTFNTSGQGAYTPSAATVTILTASVNNTGSTFTLSGSANSWQMNGATITGGTLALANSSVLNLTTATFNGVTVTGTTSLTVGNSLTLENGTVLPTGVTVNLTANFDQLDYVGAIQTADNITINANTGVTHYLGFGNPIANAAAIFTLGANALLEGNVQILDKTASDSFVNKGTVTADSSTTGYVQFYDKGNVTNNGTMNATNGALFVVNPSFNNTASFTNNGTINDDHSTLSIVTNNTLNNSRINVTNGGSLQLAGTWSNSATGTIAVSGGSTVSLSGNMSSAGAITLNNSTVNISSASMTLAPLASISATNSIINFTGTLNISAGNTLSFSGNNTFNLGVQGAGFTQNAINGGTLAFSGGSSFHLINQSATLSGVHVTGADVNVDSIEILTIANGISIDTHNLNLNATNMEVDLQNTPLLSNLVINTNVQNLSVDDFVMDGSNPIVTLDSTSTLNGGGGLFNGYNSSNNPNQATFVNDGTINVNNQSLIQNCYQFINYGHIYLEQHNMQVSTTGFSNHGLIDLQGGAIQPGAALFHAGDGTLTGTGYIGGEGLIMDQPGGQLLFHVGGVTAGSAYDQMTIAYEASLGGDLEILMTNGFESSITPGEQFIVLKIDPNTGGAVTGSFLNVQNGGRLTTTDGFGSFQVNYGSAPFTNEIVLSNFQSLPEPASAGLLAAGVIIFTRRPKRRMG